MYKYHELFCLGAKSWGFIKGHLIYIYIYNFFFYLKYLSHGNLLGTSPPSEDGTHGKPAFVEAHDDHDIQQMMHEEHHVTT